MTATVIFQFSDGEPFTLDKLNANFANIAGAVNSLAATQMLQIGAVPGSAAWVPATGGQFYGQVGVPSLVIGPPGGMTYLAVSRGDFATTTDVGVVKKAAASADSAASAASSYSQAQVQGILDELRDLKVKLRAAGLLAT